MFGMNEVRDRQRSLRELYTRQPEAALIHKHVRAGPADGRDPYHGAVVPLNAAAEQRPYEVEWGFGLDHAVGGLHDRPNPGEMLCGALAACQDGLIRMIAGAIGIELEELEVEVTGDVDVRGTLDVDRGVRVGFQALSMSVRLRAKSGTSRTLLERLCASAERLCVNLDTLRRGVAVETCYEIA
jgi:uncharacterized OsmC-like protein